MSRVFIPSRRQLLRAFAALAAGAALGVAASAPAHAAEVHNARSTDGMVGAMLYSAAGGWMKPDQALQRARASAAGTVVLVFRDLAPGAYAVSVLHDENANGRLDTNVVGLPTERYGFSRDAVGRMGPPDFAQAQLDLQGDTTVTVNLR